MTERSNTLVDLFDACWKNNALKERFLADPKAVFAEHGMPLPDGMELDVTERRICWWWPWGRGLYIRPSATRKYLVKNYGR